ncbi:unnamed protein product [Mytilus edulis]|uniref:Uncharacterized protein n=1 Tax=Mytilus edulis TaxID=6550 RepID=A0A8S3TYD8_MYTED|nr:unnamed protein product [Mytilus edulis]
MGNETSQNVSYSESLPNSINITWKNAEKTNAFPAREGQCCCGYEKTLFVFGGVLHLQSEIEPQESNDLLALDTASMKWEKIEVRGTVPSPRATASLVAVGKKLYLFGGLSHMSGWFDVMHEYDIENKTWSEIQTTGTPPAQRDKVGGVAIGTNIYYFGGFGPKSAEADLDIYDSEEEGEDELPDGSASFGWFNDLFVFDTVNKKWSQPMQKNLGVPTARAAHGMCAVGTDLVIFGGRDTQCRRNDLHIFSTDTWKWKECKVQGRQPEPRSFHTTTAIGKRVVVMGGRGEQNQHFADLHIFDTETMEWLQPKANGDLPKGRGQHSAGVVDDKLVLFGGTTDFNPEIMQCQTFFNDTYVASIDDFMKGECTKATNGHAESSS